MLRTRTAHLLALAAGIVIVLAAGGCGSSDEGRDIPPEQSQELLALLDEIDRLQADDQCVLARARAIQFSTSLNRLSPETVGYSELVQAGGNLNTLIAQNCEQPVQATTTEEPATTTPSTTTPTTTTESTSTTSTTETSTPDETDTTGDVPPGQGGTPPGQSDSGGIGAG